MNRHTLTFSFRTLGILLVCGAAATDIGSAVADTAHSENGLGIPSGTYAIDPSHAYVTFSYLHDGLSYPMIRATAVDGELELDATNLANSTASIAVDVDSIRSNTTFFDKELASAKFFNAARYPNVTFVGESFRVLGDSTGELSGHVTIRGITKPLTLAVTINGALEHPISKNPVIGITAHGSLNRSDFDLDRFIPVVSDRVDISIEAEFALGSTVGSAAAAKTARDALAAGGD